MDFGAENPSFISPNAAAAFQQGIFEDLLLLDCLQSPYGSHQLNTDSVLPVNNCHQDGLGIGCEGWGELISFDPMMLQGEEQLPEHYHGNGASTQIVRQGGESKCKSSEVNVSSDSESNGKGGSPASKSGNRVKRHLGVQKPKKGVSSCPRENHKILERERRKCMHDFFMTLHSLLPHSTSSKKEQSTILDETIKYIPMAETKLEELKNTKKSLLLSSTAEAEDTSTTGSSSLSNEDMGLTSKTMNIASSNAFSSSSPNISVKFENGEMNITVSTSNRWGAPLSLMLQELTMYGFVLRNCNVFKSGTTFFQHFNVQYACGASRPSTEQDIRGRLEKVLTS